MNNLDNGCNMRERFCVKNANIYFQLDASEPSPCKNILDFRSWITKLESLKAPQVQKTREEMSLTNVPKVIPDLGNQRTFDK